MDIDYLFSSPDGDIFLGPEELDRPFLTGPSSPHAFLTLRDYFECIETFLLKDQRTFLSQWIGEKTSGGGNSDKIRRLRIRSEKHGVLYHVASAEVIIDTIPLKLGLIAAVTEQGRRCLAHEYETVSRLNQSNRFRYLPEVYKKGSIACGTTAREVITLMLSEWLEGFHEWHFSMDAEDGREKISIWDLQNGYRYASDKEAFELLRQASMILTLYYDPHTFKQVYPWRHAAGDFIVRTVNDDVQVRLSTVRDYRSMMNFFSTDPVHPMIALVYFFLNLTIQMRLDRRDGVGETVWAGGFSVQAAAEGFFEGLGKMVRQGIFETDPIRELLSLLQSFDEHELKKLTSPLRELDHEENPADAPVIDANLDPHLSALRRVLSQFRL